MITDMHHLIGAAEIGKAFGVSRQRVQQIVTRSDFPKPVAELAMGKVWETDDVRRWAERHGRRMDEVDPGEPESDAPEP